MSGGPLVRWPDPVLSAPCAAVEAAEFGETATRWALDLALCLDDLEHLGATGLALSAPQIGLSKRMFVWLGEGGQPIPMLNPSVTEASDEAEYAPEACLSFLGPFDRTLAKFAPGLEVQVRRATRVVVHAQDCDGQLLEVEAEGLLARVFAHEIDHLDGLTMLDRVSRQQRRNAERAWAKMHPSARQGVSA